jgi:hypothetical protein
MVVKIFLIPITARMLVKEVPDQVDSASRILAEAVQRINAELPAIEAVLRVQVDAAE